MNASKFCVYSPHFTVTVSKNQFNINSIKLPQWMDFLLSISPQPPVPNHWPILNWALSSTNPRPRTQPLKASPRLSKCQWHRDFFPTPNTADLLSQRGGCRATPSPKNRSPDALGAFLPAESAVGLGERLLRRPSILRTRPTCRRGGQGSPPLGLWLWGGASAVWGRVSWVGLVGGAFFFFFLNRSIDFFYLHQFCYLLIRFYTWKIMFFFITTPRIFILCYSSS